MVDPQPIVYAICAAGILLAAGVTVWQRVRARRQATPAPPQPAAPVAPAPAVPTTRDDHPSCHFCDAPAVRAPSRFVGSEGLGAELRIRFGSTQRYAPIIDTAYAPTLCASHARVWDALLTEKMATTIERERRAAEVRIASEMAAFESEGIVLSMAKALTETQRRAYEDRKAKIPDTG